MGGDGWDGDKDFEVLPGAKTFFDIVENASSSSDAKTPILDAMKTKVVVDGVEVTPDLESLEHALHHAMLTRISELLVPEMESTSNLKSVVAVLDIAADLVLEHFNVSIAGASEAEGKSEVEKLKTWWDMFFFLAEDAARLVPGPCMNALVMSWEEKLVALKDAYVKMAKIKLEDLDKRQAEALKKMDGKPDAKEEAQRLDERKKLIGALGISPNGKIHLTMTSLLKTLSSRLSAAPYWALRGRVTLLLERLLPIDHKAIANNQRNKSSDFIKGDEIDETNDLEDGIRTPEPVKEAEEKKPEETKKEETKKEEQKKEEKVEEEEKVKEGEEKKNGADEAAEVAPPRDPHFDLYKSFWSIQESLQNPEKYVFGDHAGGGKQGDHWKKFKTALQAVLTKFASYPPGPRAGPSALLPLRHAPKSKIFRIQLDDPGFRLQFLIQILVVFQGLEEKNEKKGESVTGKQSQSVKREYRDLKAECEHAVKHICPRFLKLAKHVMSKEQLWASWKNQGCKEFEHESLQMITGKTESVDLLMKDPPGPQQKRPNVAPYMGQMLKALANPIPASTAVPTTEGVSEETLKPSQIKKMCDQYLDRLVEDEDPVNGIEEDYKMIHDKVFMWQCRRLFAQQYLREYRNASGSTQVDFMDFVYQVKGLENPKAKAAPPEADTQAAAEPAQTEEVKAEVQEQAVEEEKVTEEIKEEVKEEAKEIKEEADEQQVDEPPEKKQKIS
eukprot:gnl/MRDRNA2_/MRDRNA2_88641_c0_seq1.p1 gnl/MRDRNA2_/MRDRNA2_88641_c0~~gnl/MRDRNA2_/MRDRNA2_88641_c0_seq1.p1  ORF type:complete len:728 (-),score=218.11 gnl/MRDRNA2_/MRDRNA2_88641_c0_seq1:11-2194(-)